MSLPQFKPDSGAMSGGMSFVHVSLGFLRQPA